MKCVFDLDGTLRDVAHRRHLVAGPKKDWPEFFRQSVNDPVIEPVADLLRDLVMAGNEVEIWSGCSDEVWDETVQWLDEKIGDVLGHDRDQWLKASTLLKRMRPAKDYQPDQDLKRKWLHEAIASGWKPDLVVDDRQKVVDMWREEGLVCAQVAAGDFDTKPTVMTPNRKPVLQLMIGPSGSGKSTYLKDSAGACFDPASVVSSDAIRKQLFGLNRDGTINADAYTKEGFARTFAAVDTLVKTRIGLGLDVTVDATNLHRRDRVNYLKLVGAPEAAHVVYTIIDCSLESKLASWARRPVGHTTPEIITKQHETWQSCKEHAYKGDGLPYVEVKEIETNP